MRCTRVDRDRAHHTCVGLERGSGLGARRHGGKGFRHWDYVMQLSKTL